MSELILVPETHELLSTELEDFDFHNPPVDPKELTKELRYLMEREGGIGLSANQVGLQHRVFVINSNPALTCFNPRIAYYSDEHCVMEEGCLSYPGLYVKIRRPKTIRLRFQDENGELRSESLGGLVARVAQHELDHLNGVNYLDRAKKIHLDQAKRKSKIMKRKAKKLLKGIA